MNCQDALSLLYDVIDKEASEIDTQEVRRHLDHCQDCYKKFQIEESLQGLLKEKLKPQSDETTVEKLKLKIIGRLEDLDVEPTVSAKRIVPFRMPAVALAAAASVILLIVAGIWGVGLYNHYVDYIPLERAHWSAADNIDSFRDSEKTQTVMAGMTDSFGFTLESTKDGMNLVGAQTEEIDGVRLAHFVYGDKSSTVSYFIANKEEFNIPESVKSGRVEVNGNCYFDHNCRGCRLVYHVVGDAVIISATTDRDFDLLSFSPESNVL